MLSAVSRFATLLAIACLAAVFLAACGGDTPTTAPADTPTATPEPVALSIDEYLSQCGPRDEAPVTYGDVSALMSEVTQNLESMVPPDELAEWHHLQLGVYRAFNVVVDGQPKDDEIDFEEFLGMIVASGIDKMEMEAATRLPDDLHQRLKEANCAGAFSVEFSVESVTVEQSPSPTPQRLTEPTPEGRPATIPTPAPEASSADDHGNSVSDATEITVGEPVNVEVDIQGDTDFLRFQAEAGQSYVIRMTLRFSYAPPSIALYGSDGGELESIDFESSRDGVVWEPSSSGDYYVVIGGPDGVGSYLLTVDHLVALGDDHGDDEVRATNIDVGEAIAGNIGSEGDFDYFRFPATAGQSYRIDIALGTLIHAVASIYDSGGLRLAQGDYLEGSDLIVWEAPTTGEYYIRVLGAWQERTGTYTLTVATETDQPVVPSSAPVPAATPTPPATPRPAATPVPTASGREDITLTYLCDWGGLRSCEDMQEFFEAVQTRTGGQVNFELSHLADFGGIQEQTILMDVLQSGELDFGEARQGDFLSYPNALNLWEAFANPDDYSEVSDALAAEVIRLVGLEAEGLDLRVVGMNLFLDSYLFSRQPISSLADLEELRTGMTGGLTFPVRESLLSLWGSEIILTAFPDLYPALADGDLDAAFTCATCAANADWDLVTGHITGPIVGLRPQTLMVFGGSAWDSLPTDIQAIIEEEGAAHTRRELAKAASRESEALQTLTSRGMSYTELPPEVLAQVRDLVAGFSGLDEESARGLGLR